MANLERGIDAVEAVAAGAEGVALKEAKTVNSLEEAKRMLSIAASLDGQGSNHGNKNLYLAACAHFYLAMAYKLQKNDKLATLHLLQVLYISPYQGCQDFCKEAWDYLFLPHLLHLKVWYNDQYESIESDNYASPGSSERSRKLKMLGRLYNEHLDEGTCQFALYYKEWLMFGVTTHADPFPKPPPVRLHEGHELESPAGRDVLYFAGWDDSPYTDSDVRYLKGSVFVERKSLNFQAFSETLIVNSHPEKQGGVGSAPLSLNKKKKQIIPNIGRFFRKRKMYVVPTLQFAFIAEV